MSGAGSLRRVARGAAWASLPGAAEALASEWRALDQARAASRAEALAMAFALAERALTTVAAHEVAAATQGLAAVLTAHRWSGPVLVRAHPSEVRSCEAVLRSRAEGGLVYADGGLAAGDVIVEGRAGTVDARLTARLAAVRAEMERGR